MPIGAWLYHIFIDSMLTGLRRDVAESLLAGASVLEVACGTGAQARTLARSGHQVMGIDMDAGMIDFARRQIVPGSTGSETYRLGDAASMDFFTDGEFDYAAITLALHAMNPSDRLPVLQELSRVADTLLLVDYSCPMPQSPGGWLVRAIEFCAGRTHYEAYRSFQASGGLASLAEKAGLAVQEERIVLGGMGHIVICR